MSQAAYVLAGCQAAIAVTFARAAVTKIPGFAEFQQWLVVAVRVPRRVSGPVAVLMIAAEAATAVAVLVPALRAAGFALAVLLLGAFTAAVVSMWRRRVGVPCRCFGAGRHPPGPIHVVRNSALLLIAAAGGILAAASTTTTWEPVVGLAAVAGATVAVLLTELEEIAPRKVTS